MIKCRSKRMYKPKNVLMTGVAGFIGSHVAMLLVKAYPKIKFIGLDKISYCSNIKNINLIENDQNFKFIAGDICEMDFMRFVFQEYQIDTVLHFAAYSHVDHSFGNSLIFTKNNVVGTHTLLEAAKDNDVSRFIHVSTDEVYGNKDEISNENTMIDPTNPYSASKAAAEQLVRSYYHSFKLPVIITRGNNVYGPLQYPEKAIPRFCLRLLNKEKCQLQGNGSQTRSFMHVTDVAKAFEKILFEGKIGEIYNISSQKEYSIKEVAEMLIKYVHSDQVNCDDFIEYVKDRDFNDQRYNINGDKLRNLGWEQLISFEYGLKSTFKWYQEHQNYWMQEQLETALICDNQIIN